MRLSIQAPAKINRFLYILRRLPDGYHQILTMFEKVALFDRIEIEVEESAGTDISIDCPKWLSSGPQNLVYKAAEAFALAAEKRLLMRAKIEKHIPAGGGLGGGSSDAAATLRMLNQLTGQPLRRQELYEIAGRLGADVPFFLTDWPCAVGTGTGTELEPCTSAGPYWYVLVFPDFSVSTRWAYENFKLTRKSDITIFDRRRLLSGDIWENDLEEPVCARYPELLNIKKSLLKAGAEASLMSGSGSTVFGAFKDSNRASQGAATVRAETGMNCIVTRTLE